MWGEGVPHSCSLGGVGEVGGEEHKGLVEPEEVWEVVGSPGVEVDSLSQG